MKIALLDLLDVAVARLAAAPSVPPSLCIVEPGESARRAAWHWRAFWFGVVSFW